MSRFTSGKSRNGRTADHTVTSQEAATTNAREIIAKVEDTSFFADVSRQCHDNDVDYVQARRRVMQGLSDQILEELSSGRPDILVMSDSSTRVDTVKDFLQGRFDAVIDQMKTEIGANKKPATERLKGALNVATLPGSEILAILEESLGRRQLNSLVAHYASHNEDRNEAMGSHEARDIVKQIMQDALKALESNQVRLLPRANGKAGHTNGIASVTR